MQKNYLSRVSVLISKMFIIRRENSHPATAHASGTVIFSHGGLEGRPKAIADDATDLCRPWLEIDLRRTSPLESAHILAAWIKAHNIAILNVTGSEDPGAYFLRVRVVLETAFELQREQEAWESMPPGSSVH